jgi:hypothetical protein
VGPVEWLLTILVKRLLSILKFLELVNMKADYGEGYKCSVAQQVMGRGRGESWVGSVNHVEE